MSQRSRILTALGAIIVISGGLIGISVANDHDKKQQPTSQAPVQQKQPTLQVAYPGSNGQDALSLLKANYNVETKSYEGLGELVTSINGVEPDSKHFWAFYVNGQQSQVGAGQYETQSTDTLTWKLETIQ